MIKVIFVTLCHFMPSNHAEVATKQAVLETGWFKSYACKNLCNPFGLSWKGKLQEFESIEQACQEYHKQIYLQYKGGDYYEFLVDMGYAQDSNYIWKLKHIYINGIHDRTEEQCVDSLHGRPGMGTPTVLPPSTKERILTTPDRGYEIPPVLGLVDTSVVKGSFPADPDDGDSSSRVDRFGRHRETPQIVIKRVY